MHFLQVLEYGPDRPSPEKKLRDVNLKFLPGCVPEKLQSNIYFSGKFGYFRHFPLRDASFFFIIHSIGYYNLYYMFPNVQYD